MLSHLLHIVGPWQFSRARPLAYCNMSLALVELGRVEEAIEACKRALFIEPGSAATNFNMGTMLLSWAIFGMAGKLTTSDTPWGERNGCAEKLMPHPGPAKPWQASRSSFWGSKGTATISNLRGIYQR